MAFMSDPAALHDLRQWLLDEHGFQPRPQAAGYVYRTVGDAWLIEVFIDGRVFTDPKFDPKGATPKFYLTRIDVEQQLAQLQDRDWSPGVDRPTSIQAWDLRQLVASKRVGWYVGEPAAHRSDRVDYETMQAETLEALAAVEAMCDLDEWIVGLHDDYGWNWSLPPAFGWARLAQHAMAGEAEYASVYASIGKIRSDERMWERLGDWMQSNPAGIEPHGSTNRRLRADGRLLAPGELDLDACRTQDVLERIDTRTDLGEVLAIDVVIEIILQEDVSLPGNVGSMPAGTDLAVHLTALTGLSGTKYPPPDHLLDDQTPLWDNVTAHIAPPFIRNQSEREAAEHDHQYQDTQKLFAYASQQGVTFAYARLTSGKRVDGTRLPSTYPITITDVELWEIGR